MMGLGVYYIIMTTMIIEKEINEFQECKMLKSLANDIMFCWLTSACFARKLSGAVSLIMFF